LTTFTGVRGNSSFMARGEWSSMYPFHRRLVKQSQYTSAMVAERAHRGASFFAYGHLGLVWLDRGRLARLFVLPSRVGFSPACRGAADLFRQRLRLPAPWCAVGQALGH
jgi:hypothetical protein